MKDSKHNWKVRVVFLVITKYFLLNIINLEIQVITSQKFEYKIVKNGTNEEIPLRIEPRLNNLQKIYFELLTGPKFVYYTVKSNQIENESSTLNTTVAPLILSSKEIVPRKFSAQSNDSAYASRMAERPLTSSGRSSQQSRACSSPPSVRISNTKSDLSKSKLRNSQINVQLEGKEK